MPWSDGHLDLAYLAIGGRELLAHQCDSRVGCITLPALRAAGVNLCCATIFTEPVASTGSAGPHTYPPQDALAAEAAGLRQLEVYERLQEQGHLRNLRSRAELCCAGDDGATLGIVILMEGADPIRSPAHVGMWFSRGVRIVGLAWAAGTRYAGGNSAGGGLTPAGSELVVCLDEAGIIHDVSHLSDRAFEQVMELARGRVIASHSNCRALLQPSQRHLRDDQIKAIGERGGIVGLNLYSKFLAVGRRATVADCLAHVQHVASVMGHRRGVALGSDMDGGFAPGDLPADLDHPAKLGALAEALRLSGWSDVDIAGFAWRNWRDFFARALP